MASPAHPRYNFKAVSARSRLNLAMPVLPWFGSFWKRLSEQVLSPRVDSAEVEEQLRRAREKLPQPVIWLLGKTQSGKSSIVRALTGSTDAEIGHGFRPCTRTARLYSFPSDEDCLVQFLDTRGLGEANYDPREDIAVCQRQAHLLIVTVRAMDHAFQTVIDAVKAVRKVNPEFPIAVVQTALHDGYPAGGSHPEPYPFEADQWPVSVPADLSRSLRRQREEFAGLVGRFVPIDFTLPEDELPPQYYGEDALWAALDTEIGLGLRALLQPELQDLYYRKARPHVLSYAIAAGSAAALPNPAISLPLIAAIDAKMFHAIASIYEQRLTARVMGELGSAIGSGFAVRLAGRSLLAMIPVVGTPFAAAYGAATSYALGRTLCWYFAEVRNGVTPAADKIRATFAKGMAEGRRRFRKLLKQ